jgi:hypothetical protein
MNIISFLRFFLINIVCFFLGTSFITQGNSNVHQNNKFNPNVIKNNTKPISSKKLKSFSLPSYRAEYNVRFLPKEKPNEDIADVRGRMDVTVQGAVSSSLNSAVKGINYNEQLILFVYPNVSIDDSNISNDDDFNEYSSPNATPIQSQITFFERQRHPEKRSYYFVIKKEEGVCVVGEYSGNAYMIKDPHTGHCKGGEMNIFGTKKYLSPALFPLEFHEDIVNTLKKGKKSLSRVVFDPSNGGNTPVIADVLISGPFTPKIQLTSPLMPTQKAWTIQISYTDRNCDTGEENLVIHTMLENGVIIKSQREIDGMRLEMTLEKIELFLN